MFGHPFTVTARPFYTVEGRVFHLDEELAKVPEVGDVVFSATDGVDEDGDLLVTFDGIEVHIASAVLAPAA